MTRSQTSADGGEFPMAFNVGDVVQLKSGGPFMTVNNADVQGEVECVWFENNDQKYGRFNPAVLKAVNMAGAPRSAIR
jgi:uncharacterized protein YodC (DUF2158 family)